MTSCSGCSASWSSELEKREAEWGAKVESVEREKDDYRRKEIEGLEKILEKEKDDYHRQLLNRDEQI